MDFQISDSKLETVIRLVRNHLGDEVEASVIEGFVLADWHEGQEHQAWLDYAGADEIADWAIAGLK